MSIATLNPWQVLDQLQNERFSQRNGTARYWRPVADISESKEEYHIYLELPGVKQDQVNVSLEDNKLTISGNKQREQQEGNQFRYQERATGAFNRTFKLPEDADSNGISARFDQGLLVVTIRKQEQTKPRKIDIQSS